MEDEPSPPKSNHKEDSNLYKAPCYDRLLIAYSPRTSLTTSSHLTPVSLCGIQCLYWVLYGHPYLAVRPRGGLTRRYRRCGLTSRQQTTPADTRSNTFTCRFFFSDNNKPLSLLISCSNNSEPHYLLIIHFHQLSFYSSLAV